MSATTVAMPNGLISNVDAFGQLDEVLATQKHQFLRSTPELQQIAIQAVKAALDPVATSVSNAQITRRSENKRKRKRGSYDDEEGQTLQIKQIYTNGFGTKQVWEQAKRVLEAACMEVENVIVLNAQKQLRKTDLREVSDAQDKLLGEFGSDIDERDDLQDEDAYDDEDEQDMLDEDEASNAEDIEADSDIMDDSDAGDELDQRQQTYTQDPNGLNDGFFSIDDFNKQTQFLEQMDARGDDDNPSDEDEIDWDADPLFMGSSLKSGKQASKHRNEESADEDESDEEEDDGPTLADAPLDDLDDDDDEDDDIDMDEDQDLDIGMGLSNANDINYADFFEPPPKKLSKSKRMRALPKTQPAADPKSVPNEDEVRNDIERAMQDVRRDLLDSDEEDDFEDEEGDDSDNDKAPRSKVANKNMSTHEKQKATIAAEIRRLEAANVAKRDWQLSGEARAADRPVNSLLEEDMEFERVGKPVPVVTAETSEELEQLIKRRILAREFDEVIRRSAAGVGSASDTRRGRIELDDHKSKTSLGELYEQDHLKKTDPASYVDKRSAATKKQHEQIDLLWREVNDQLNLLSNLNFKPKRIDIQISTVEDKPRIAMEDARPVGEFESGEGGRLAPQEVYKPSGSNTTNGTSKEVTLRGTGTAVNREEMTREEKLRRRRREKERIKKSQTNKTQIVLGKQKPSFTAAGNTRKANKEQEKAEIISDLEKGNVKILGKDGEVTTLNPKAKKSRVEQLGTIGTAGAGNLKL